MKKITMGELDSLAKRAASTINHAINIGEIKGLTVFPIPSGGISATLALLRYVEDIVVTDEPKEADFFFDDLIDSGATLERWCDQYPHKPFYALIDKNVDADYMGKWLVFPWEGNDHSSFEDNIIRILQFIGEDPKREGLIETPHRVAKAWRHWCSGYGKDPKDILKVFEDGAEKYDQLVTVKDIPIYSTCEHHLAPIFGTCTISYIPDGRIVGLSKLSRLADMYARRLQVQERLTKQIADALMQNLQPLGVGVVIKARHMCMEARGVCQQGHYTITSAVHGVLRSDPSARSEFMALAT